MALISVYAAPDPLLLEESSGTLMVCRYLGNTALKIIFARKIASCVAMVPFLDPPDGRVFVCQKIGLEMARMAGVQEEVEDDN